MDGAQNTTVMDLILPLDAADATLEQVGGKGASLARMAAAGLPVPPGFHITTAAYRSFVAHNGLQEQILAATSDVDAQQPTTLDNAASRISALFAQGTMPADIAQAIQRAYAGLGADNPAVAVRSSATAEDLPGLSFAGQQETYLNMRGSEMVLDAVKRCWASLWTARAIGYRAQHNIAPQDVSLAVVVQQLVDADVAGILFTANPLTGARDQVMINAAWGLGEAIVSGQVTPDTLVLNKASGEIVTREIADKRMMTMRTDAGTREAEVPAERRLAPALTAEQAAGLLRLGLRIEQLYRQPMDIEWAIQDEHLFVLQARPITTLAEHETTPAEIPAPEWHLPDPKGKYMRGSVLELLPDPLSPLFATLGLPAWSNSLKSVYDDMNMTGIFTAEPFTTINGYSYYNVTLTPLQSARFLLVLPRILLFTLPKLLRTAASRWQAARSHYGELTRRWQDTDLRATPASKLLAGADSLTAEAARYYIAIQTGILPAAYMSESLFTLVYNRFLRRRNASPALTFMLGYESEPLRAEKSLYELAQWAREQVGLATALTGMSGTTFTAAYSSRQVAGVDDATWAEFKSRLAAHLAAFGHAIYDLDFAKPVPVDDPASLLETLKFFLSGTAPDPAERQQKTAAAREEANQAALRHLRGVRLTLFRRLLSWAQRFAPLREDALADTGLAWPVLRQMLQEIGRRVSSTGGIDQPEDIFWLTLEEVQAAAATLDAGRSPVDYHAAIAGRRASWERERTMTPPASLPLKGGSRLLGIDFSNVLPARTNQAVGDTIKGIAASPGRVTGTARVIAGPSEFGQMRPGDILVAKITTPAWTPLFALAAGVVTDVGGPLSHSSIVAREYHIPAVLGTGVATERVRSGQHITVDGTAGTVTLSNPGGF